MQQQQQQQLLHFSAPEAVLVCFQRAWHFAALATQAWPHPQVR
jgi:hypothetical protein